MSSIRKARFEKRRFFLGCEGESEVAYGLRVGELINEPRDDIYLNVVLLRPCAGDPLALVEKACAKLAQEYRDGPDLAYEDKWILLDTDLLGENKKRDVNAMKLAKREGIKFIWQKPCHEGFLLRHFEKYKTHNPTAALAERRLKSMFPAYKKGLTRKKLAPFIGHTQLHCAASVETDLNAFLFVLGYSLKKEH
jgi:hypothetical protein